MNFQFYDPANIEFGVCRGPLVDAQSAIVPVDGAVRTMLEQMVLATRAELGLDSNVPMIDKYELSEQYPSKTPLTLPLNDPLVDKIRALFSYANIPTNAKMLDDVKAVTAYFCIIYDHTGQKLLAMRRAVQFKAMLKRRLIRVFDETLRAVTDTVFQLDPDFDLLITDDTVYILRPAAFEQLADIDTEILDQAGKNTLALDAMVPGIRFSAIAPYVSHHKRAARIIAALLRRGDLADISVTNLRRECRRNGIPVDAIEGQLVPHKGDELAFLNLLDRRRYVVSLIPRKWEQYEAGSRKGVGVRENSGADQVEESSPKPKAVKNPRSAKALRAR
jgi:hypothetical protein